MYIVSGSKTKVTGGGLKINSGASTILRARDSIHGRILYSSLIDVAREHPHLRSTINKIGMSAVSGGFDIEKFGGDRYRRNNRQRNAILRFLYPQGDAIDWSYYQSGISTESKIYQTAALFLMGPVAWEILRNPFGKAIGFDIIWGYVEPNYDDAGKFKSPAYIQYLGDRYLEASTWKNPRDIVYYAFPDLCGKAWGTPLESLLPRTLPSDVAAQEAYLSLHTMSNAPQHGLWMVSPKVDDDDYDMFVAMLLSQQTGASNFGRTPVAIRGQVEWVPYQRKDDKMPYADGRNFASDEISETTGVPASVAGRTVGIDTRSVTQQRWLFHELTTKPLCALIGSTFRQQVCLREFDAPGWWLAFKHPQLLTQLELVSVARSARQWGLVNTNEGRALIGHPPIEEDWADRDYLMPMNMANANPEGGEGHDLVPTDNTDLPSTDSENVGNNQGDIGQPMQERLNMMRMAELDGMEEHFLDHYDDSDNGHYDTMFLSPGMSAQLHRSLQQKVAGKTIAKQPDKIKDLFASARELLKTI